MTTGSCSKCGNADVRTSEHIADWKEAIYDGIMPTGDLWRGGVIVDHRVCTQCGYIEAYIRDPKAIAEIARTWPTSPGEPK